MVFLGGVMIDDKCLYCKFWKEYFHSDHGNGCCRVNPPDVKLGFPTINEDNWCGKFENKGK